MKDVISIYNNKNSFFVKKTGLFPSVEHLIQKLDIAIVIPACNEYPTLFETLESIHASYQKAQTTSKPYSLGFIIVVNNKKSASLEIKENNKNLLQSLSNYTLENCSIITINLTQENFEVPEAHGVGHCRKYGMDFALLCDATLIACMDADTHVSENYCEELFSFYEKCKSSKENKKAIPVGAVTHFDHQKNADEEIDSIAREYESYMRTHSEKLKECGTPFWLWSLGPTIVSSSYGYAGSAGMNKRIAGEDFYFLQSLVKLHIQQNNNGFTKDDIEKTLEFPILNCTVCPQSRYSDRVLFGTGKKLQDVKYGKDKIVFYSEDVYESIKKFLNYVTKAKGNPDLFYNEVRKQLPAIWQFLEKENFFLMWKELYRQNKKSDKRVFSAFHSWFDGLKILRLIHILSHEVNN